MNPQSPMTDEEKRWLREAVVRSVQRRLQDDAFAVDPGMVEAVASAIALERDVKDSHNWPRYAWDAGAAIVALALHMKDR